MTTAPKGNHSTWVRPEGRVIAIERHDLALTNDLGQQPRAYSITLDGRYIGHVIRYRSARGVWRLNVGPTAEYPERSYPLRGDAIDALVGIDDHDRLGRYQAAGAGLRGGVHRGRAAGDDLVRAMTSNYPPGVTGSEPQITGDDDEGLTNDEWALVTTYREMVATMTMPAEPARTLVIVVPLAAAVVAACGGEAQAIEAMKVGAMHALIARATGGDTAG
jgi:hypothetical protein